MLPFRSVLDPAPPIALQNPNSNSVTGQGHAVPPSYSHGPWPDHGRLQTGGHDPGCWDLAHANLSLMLNWGDVKADPPHEQKTPLHTMARESSPRLGPGGVLSNAVMCGTFDRLKL